MDDPDFPTEGAVDPILSPDDWEFLDLLLLNPLVLLGFAAGGLIMLWGLWRRR